MNRQKRMWRRSWILTPIVALVAVLSLAACGDDDDDEAFTSTTGGELNPGISVEEALAYEGTELVLVRGFLIAVDGGEVSLCGGQVMESAPPQCGDPQLTVEGLELDKLDGLRHNDGWSEGDVRLLGRMDGEVLTIEPQALPD